MTAKEITKEPMAALFLGGLVGAGVALMFAPLSGKQLRLKIGEVAEEVSDKTHDYIGQGKEKAVSLSGKGQDYFRGRKAMFAAGINAGKEAYAKERERLGRRH